MDKYDFTKFRIKWPKIFYKKIDIDQILSSLPKKMFNLA